MLVRWRGVLGPRVPRGGNCFASFTESADGEGGEIGGLGGDLGLGGRPFAGTTTATGTGTTGSLGCSIAWSQVPSTSLSGGISPMCKKSNSRRTSAAFSEMHMNNIIISTSSKRESSRQMCMSMDLPKVLPVRLKNTVNFSSVSSKETSSGVGS